MKKIKYILLGIIVSIFILMFWVCNNPNPILQMILPIVSIVLLITYFIVATLTKEYSNAKEKQLNYYGLFVGSIGLLVILIIYILDIFKIIPHYELTIPLVSFIFTLALAVFTVISLSKKL
ncbi:hypothetical protein [Aminipila sp.]|uniref:hypothetical protein n=1 Tax=Aminipila sp. TaxID=2060095 RepID=UPI00289CA2B9|nr:hypothetical protein [Aminipila sp.]